jgi:AraC family transcriptional regulator
VGKMLKPYNLLESILLDIENEIKNNINASFLSKKYGFSEGHLRRLFSFAFKQSISAYIRSRILAASIYDLLETDANIIDISTEYGFEYEQSYIRTFKREFGVTPGDLRKSRQIIKIKPPLNLFDGNKMGDSVFFGPDIVMVPQFHIIGKYHRVSLGDSRNDIARQFWNNERMLIKSTINPHVFIGLTRNFNKKTGISEYLPSIQVKNFKNIPQGFCKDTFETSLCARFRYIGQHHYSDIDRNVVGSMYNAINATTEFSHNNLIRYTLLTDKVCFEKIDTKLYDGTFCQMEWYTPVSVKQ